MKKSKVLVPALGVLCLGMAAAVSGTVAWYAANTVVTASGINVKASVARNLVISNYDQNTWAASATAKTTDTLELNPVSAANVTGPQSFFVGGDGDHVDYNSGKLTDGGTVSKAFGAEKTTWSEGTNDSYVRVDTFYVKLDAVSTERATLKLSSLTVANVTKDISKSLRVGIVCGTVKNIYSITGGETEYDAMSKAGTVAAVDGDKYYADLAKTDGLTTTVNAVSPFAEIAVTADNGLVGGTPLKCEVLTWYEGQDDNCTSAKSITAEALSISLSFSIAAKA